MTPGRDDDLSLSYDEGDGIECGHGGRRRLAMTNGVEGEEWWRCQACGELFTETTDEAGRTVRTTVPATAVAPDHGAR